MPKTQLNALLQSTRPPFLVLTPVCVFLGLSIALIDATTINVATFFIILLGAISAHVCVNTLNEYYDFKTGLDLKTTKTPFSGGSGALPEQPDMASSVLLVGVASLCVTVAIGIYLILTHNLTLLPIGIAGLLLVITYTQLLNRMPFLCLIAPGLGFGILMVSGTHLVLTGTTGNHPLLVALIPFFLINNILLLNQYPDMKADADTGRRTFPIVFGLKNSNMIYALFMLSAYALIALYIGLGYLPRLSGIALLPLALASFALFGAIKYNGRIGDFPQYLGANVAAGILTPLLLGVSLVLV